MNSLREFKEWFINLNESTLDNIVTYYDENVFFKDPFNEFNGREKLKKLFIHMFNTLKIPHEIFYSPWPTLIELLRERQFFCFLYSEIELILQQREGLVVNF